MDLKDEFKSLEPSLRRRIKRVSTISMVWVILINVGDYKRFKTIIMTTTATSLKLKIRYPRRPTDWKSKLKQGFACYSWRTNSKRSAAVQLPTDVAPSMKPSLSPAPMANALRTNLDTSSTLSFIFATSRAGLVLGSAGIFHLCKPWLDKRRLEREALLAAELEEGRDSELLKT